MTVHIRREIEVIKKHILALGALVEQNVFDAVRALDKKDIQLAREVIQRDDEIDLMEVEIEEDCLKILALYQPVAIDLRYIVAVLKINSDLERIGDLAVNVAQSAEVLTQQERIRVPEHVIRMTQETKKMVHQSLTSLIDLDEDIARTVLISDDIVDDLHKKTFTLVEERLVAEPDLASEFIRLLGISRNLERIADHATNIAEDVIYMIDGAIIRHHLAQE